MIKKSITITEAQDEWLRTQMSDGQYASDSEIIREALREKQARMDGIEKIRAALVEGEESGISDVSMEEIRQSVLTKLKRDGRL